MESCCWCLMASMNSRRCRTWNRLRRSPCTWLVTRCSRDTREAFVKLVSPPPAVGEGGIHGFTVYDEVLAPASTLQAMRDLEIDAAVLVGPDWPFVEVGGEHGLDEVVRRYRDRPELPFVFVQAPPGIGSILVTRRGSGRSLHSIPRAVRASDT